MSTLLLWMAVACAPKAPPAVLLEPGGEGIARAPGVAASVDVTVRELPAGASVRRGRWLPPPGQGAAVVYPTMERVDGP